MSISVFGLLASHLQIWDIGKKGKTREFTTTSFFESQVPLLTTLHSPFGVILYINIPSYYLYLMGGIGKIMSTPSFQK